MLFLVVRVAWLFCCVKRGTTKMEGFNADFLLQLVSLLIGGGAVYGAIKADLAALHKRVDYLYQRIDRK